ncbi:MAG: UbiA family prenyltransferase [Candidatus Kapaibacterium sp.]
MKNERSFLSRFAEYQKERFPLLAHGPLILVFTFSAISYSRVCRGADGFISVAEFAVGGLTAISFFLLLRLFDEFKDAEEDARYRPYRPVPRGLVTLRELRTLGITLTLFFVAANALLMPRTIPAILLVLFYMVLMSKEFFVRDWLKRHPVTYMLSHMVIMPMIDFYTTGLDWLNAGVSPPQGLEFFLLVTFLNGVVIEMGRKIRAPKDEEEGVETYSALYGSKRAALIWLCVVFVTWGSAVLASNYAGYGNAGIIALSAVLLLCSIPALLFANTLSPKYAKRIETAAGVWTIGMYLTLGGVPMITRWISSW